MSAGLASDYVEQRTNAVRACEAIDPSLSESGLLFNPDGYRSYYVRSKCFQEAAILFRDSELCTQVKQRRSLISSSWGYSPSRCRELVAKGTADDRASLESLEGGYRAGGITLRDFRVERNGNGRDIDIIPSFAGTFAHGYTLTIEILPPSPGRPAAIHTSGYYLDGANDIRIFIRQAEIQQHLPGFALNRSYTVRATVTLDVGYGGQSGYWSPTFIESVFPVRERSQAITRASMF
jgi:hypothetical protein